jgi:hypothetical protein
MRRLPAQTWLVVLIVILLAGAAVAFTSRRQPPDVGPRPAAERPRLLLLTSLPLVFSEEFSLQGGGSPALRALDTRYEVVPIATTDAGSLKQAGLLLMAHPLAQPAENLVALDMWVRAGGRVLLLADPRLEWPSKRPLGDKLRPPPGFADTGLLAHWGLRLDAPDQTGPEQRKAGGRDVLTVSPGALEGTCRISRDRLVATCRVGRGEAVVIADADFINADALGEPGKNNLDALLGELATLEAPPSH